MEVNIDFDHTYADYIDVNWVEALQELEKETGTRILTYYPPPGPAHLSEKQLKRIEELEQQLCIRLNIALSLQTCT